MKATVTITLEVENRETLSRILEAGLGQGVAYSVASAETPQPQPEPEPEATETAPPKRKAKRKTAKRKTAKKAAEEPKPEPTEVEPEEVTEADLKATLNEAIAKLGITVVRGILANFMAKDKSKVKRFHDIQERDFAAVKAAAEAAMAEAGE